MKKIGKNLTKNQHIGIFFTLQQERCSHSWLNETPPESSTIKKFFCFCPIFRNHFDLLGSGSGSTDPIEF